MSRYTFKQKNNNNNTVAYGYDRPLKGYFVDVIKYNVSEPDGEDESVLSVGSNIILASGNKNNIKSNGEIIEILLELGCDNQSHLQKIVLDIPF